MRQIQQSPLQPWNANRDPQQAISLIQPKLCNSFISVLFFVFLSIVVSVSGCATVDTKQSIPHGVSQSFEGTGITEQVQKWDDLINEGKTFGIDFSNAVFGQVYSLEKAKRFCNVPQTALLKKKEWHSLLICSLSDVYSSVQYYWTDNETVDAFVKSNAHEVSDKLREQGKKSTDKIDIIKVTEWDGMLFYSIKIGEDYLIYKGVFAVENEVTKGLGINIMITVHASDAKNFDPNSEEKSLLAWKHTREFVSGRLKLLKRYIR